VDHDRIDADQFHQHDVAGEALVQRRVDHRVAAELDHDRASGETLDVRQRLREDAGDVEGGVGGQGHDGLLRRAPSAHTQKVISREVRRGGGELVAELVA
jgi:hypothetical protein